MQETHTDAARTVLIHSVGRAGTQLQADFVAVESPLEIRLGETASPEITTICITMRTPGADEELVLGYLFAEGVIESASDVERFEASEDGVGTVYLRTGRPVELRRLQRNVFTSSSCGVCGAPSLDAVAHARCSDLPRPAPTIDAELIFTLPEKLFGAQANFRKTGGLHAAALYDGAGALLRVREDVGRHNAMDKLIGSCLLSGPWPLDEHVVLVSGRTSYELAQKAIRARISVLAGVGAPSSLAIELAQAHEQTLIGFLRGDRYNVYHGVRRLRAEPAASSK